MLKIVKGHNSGKIQSSLTSIKYDHLKVMGAVTRVSSKSLENCKRSCGDNIMSTGGLTE